jgi:amino acid adenylation domain-containing protein
MLKQNIRDKRARLSEDQQALLKARLQSKISSSADPNQFSGFKHLPAVAPDPEHLYEPFPLTDMQQAYWIGRNAGVEMGNTACYVYQEIEITSFDLVRCNAALQRLIERHEMLRMIVLPDGRQQILEHVRPYEIEVLDLTGLDSDEVNSRIENVRRRMSHQVMPLDRWPLFEICASLLDEHKIRLHFGFDTMVADAWSFRILILELSQLYENPDAVLPRLDLTFRDYALAEAALQDTETYKRSLEYWQERLVNLPAAPELPLAKNPASITRPLFVRRRGTLDEQSWSRFKTRVMQAGLTSTAVVLTAYVEVLAMWSKSPHFTINVPRFNRLPMHPQVNDLVGEFASFTLVEVDLSERSSFEDRARRIQEQLWKDMSHSLVSGVRVLRELARIQGGGIRMSMPAVFTSTLGLNIFGSEVMKLPVMGEIVYSITQTPQVWLDHQVFETDGALLFHWDTVEELFPPNMMDDMFAAYGDLLQRLADDESTWLDTSTPLVPLPAEQWSQRLLVNDTAASEPCCLLHSLALDQMQRQPGQPAVITATRSLSYAELHQRAWQVAHWLRQRGIGPNQLVAVVMEKGWEQVVGVLGVLFAGAAYLPIDPDLPVQRLRYLLEHGEVTSALTQSWLSDKLEWPEQVTRLCLDLDEQLDGLSTEEFEPTVTDDDLAYVIYTSGSTGAPKGVMIAHRGVVNSVLYTNERFKVGPDDRALALTSLHHDMSVYDIFGILAAGAAIVMPDASSIKDPAHWAQLMARENVTIWNSVPAMFQMLIDYAASSKLTLPSSLRYVFLGGDWIPVTFPARLKALAENAQLISVGGPTETTLWNITYLVDDPNPAWLSIPYGKPIANTRYYILNDSLDHRPTWATGQMYCAGVGLAKGYWRDETKTNASFFPHPKTGERLYATGDLGRYLPDGNIEFIGRDDLQVKILGQRIELGEIETCLIQHPSVRSAVVVALGESRQELRLAAFYVPEQENASTELELRDYLKDRLPRHMVPSSFTVLDALPLTANGKIDRNRLPKPVLSLATKDKSLTPGAPALTNQMAEIIAGILEVDRIDPDVDLMTIGATSLHIARIANQLETTYGFRPEINQLFNLPTIRALAEYYEERLLANQFSPTGGQQNSVPSSSYQLILDPAGREEFKRQQFGVRRDVSERPLIQLPLDANGYDSRYAERFSHRRFGLRPIPLEDFAGFLRCLSQITLNDKPKYLYASGGGLYPVQVYLHIKPGRIKGLAAGTYYYQPVNHHLVLLAPEASLDRNIHYPMNRPIFDEAAFSIFLVAQLSAITPLYGEKARDYCLIEAGLIASQLEFSARENQLGLCQIGSLNFDQIGPLFELEDTHIFLHSLLGGAVEEQTIDVSIAEGSTALGQGSSAKIARMMERIDQLSEAEVDEILKNQKP